MKIIFVKPLALLGYWANPEELLKRLVDLLIIKDILFMINL